MMSERERNLCKAAGIVAMDALGEKVLKKIEELSLNDQVVMDSLRMALEASKEDILQKLW